MIDLEGLRVRIFADGACRDHIDIFASVTVLEEAHGDGIFRVIGENGFRIHIPVEGSNGEFGTRDEPRTGVALKYVNLFMISEKCLKSRQSDGRLWQVEIPRRLLFGERQNYNERTGRIISRLFEDGPEILVLEDMSAWKGSCD